MSIDTRPHLGRRPGSPAPKAAQTPDGAPVSDFRRARVVFGVSGALVAAFTVSLIVRKTGSSITALDGWGVCAFELLMGALVMSRYFQPGWRTRAVAADRFPLVLGAACVSWAVGDVALTIESLGGANPPSPSVADGFYIGFFVLCFVSFAMLIRRGNRASLLATSLDGLVAGLGVAAVAAAYIFDPVLRATGGGRLSAAINLAYPLGDVLLLAMAVGGMVVLSRGFRPFFAIAAVALAVNAIGDTYNLLQPDSRIGYIANGVAWPVSLTLLALAAWVHRPSAESRKTDMVSGFAVPSFGVLAGMSILWTASFGRVGRPAVGLATATLLVAALRLALTIREAQALKSARFRSLIDKAWNLIMVAERDLELAYVTPSATRVLGLEPEAMEGSSFMDIVHPDACEDVSRRLGELVSDRGGAVAFECPTRHCDGSWRTLSWTATDMTADQSVRGFVLNGVDVTEARRAEEQLVAARDTALSASKAKSQFVSTMSHEIRTPMNGVIGLTELLLQTEMDGEQRELATGVKVSAENLLVIINDILDFSKMEAGKLDLDEGPVDLSGVVDDVGRILAVTAHGKDIELLVDVQPGIPDAVIGDRIRIQQILLNLGSNAVKFTSAGEVVIRVSLLHENAERVALHFEVVDTGIGIAPEDHDRLFSAFAQEDSSTTRRYGGTGLGLTICRQLVELMGGKLGLQSTKGTGSTFWFDLSLRRADGQASPTDSSEIRSLSGQRALIVDDNATNRRILRQQLLSWGVDAVEATDGFEALALAERAARSGRAFDLGVVDLNMPGMDGFELAGRLKEEPSTAGTTLFLLSSSGERLSSAESHLSGFAASLTKPVRASELFDCLMTSLNGGRSAPRSTDEAARNPEDGQVKGLILLVEDNSMNQLVGAKVLEKLGYRYDVAVNGIEAVRAVVARAYDAVLMDCQMPEMDGFEATREIRRDEGAARHVPIIAMTAAAMAEDREACMAAGMDDFITKPVRLEPVSAVLSRWVGPGERHEPTSAPKGSPAEPSSDAIDWEQVELLRSLDDGVGGTLVEIVDEYLAQSVDERAELGAALTELDADGVKRVAHTLKGASANVGAATVATVCAELEARARQEQLDALDGLVDRLDLELARAHEALRRLATRS